MENRVQEVQPWWILTVAGIISILFGIAALAWPGLTLLVLVWLYGAYALIYGIVELVGTAKAVSAHTTWWTHLLIAVVSIAVGLYVVFNVGISSFVLLWVIALWAVIIGVVEVVAGIGQAQFLPVVTGVISILFGFVLFANPLGGALALVWVIGLFAIVRGIVLLVGAWKTPTTPAVPS